MDSIPAAPTLVQVERFLQIGRLRSRLHQSSSDKTDQPVRRQLRAPEMDWDGGRLRVRWWKTTPPDSGHRGAVSHRCRSGVFPGRNVERGDTQKQTGSRWIYDPIRDLVSRPNFISPLAAGKFGEITQQRVGLKETNRITWWWQNPGPNLNDYYLQPAASYRQYNNCNRWFTARKLPLAPSFTQSSGITQECPTTSQVPIKQRQTVWPRNYGWQL